jgi:putative oxidoreductase
MSEPIERSRLYVPALAGIYDGLADLAYPFLRIAFGAWYIPHGWAKIIDGGVTGTAGFMTKLGFPIPEVLAYYIGFLELVGGALLVLGLLTRLVAIQFVGFMFVAAFFVNTASWWWTKEGTEMPLLLLVLALVIFVRGGGNLSVDKSMSKEF